jgi:hypothetical protein
LFERKNGAEQLIWKQNLPHQFGPRYIFVADNGQVTLIEEWINIKSDHAITVINRENQTLAKYSFDDLQRIIGLPSATIVRRAKLGWWISAPPVLETSSHKIKIASSGLFLFIEPSTGAITLSPPIR